MEYYCLTDVGLMREKNQAAGGSDKDKDDKGQSDREEGKKEGGSSSKKDNLRSLLCQNSKYKFIFTF